MNNQHEIQVVEFGIGEEVFAVPVGLVQRIFRVLMLEPLSATAVGAPNGVPALVRVTLLATFTGLVHQVNRFAMVAAGMTFG